MASTAGLAAGRIVMGVAARQLGWQPARYRHQTWSNSAAVVGCETDGYRRRMPHGQQAGRRPTQNHLQAD